VARLHDEVGWIEPGVVQIPFTPDKA
jgi:hypothetical protein